MTRKFHISVDDWFYERYLLSTEKNLSQRIRGFIALGAEIIEGKTLTSKAMILGLLEKFDKASTEIHNLKKENNLLKASLGRKKFNWSDEEQEAIAFNQTIKNEGLLH